MSLRWQLVLVGMFCLFNYNAYAQGCVRWEWRNPLPHGNHINDIIYDGSEFWAVCDGGILMSSSDGSSWELDRVDAHRDLLAIALSSTMYLAVGRNGSNVHRDRPAGDWETGPGFCVTTNGVAYGAGWFVAVGDDGEILTAVDGSLWFRQVSTVSTDLHDVIYDGTQFLAVGEDGTLCTSPDGVVWTHTTNIGGVNQTLYDIEFFSNRYLATGANGAVVYSPDGTTWSNWSILFGNDHYDSFVDGNRYYAVGRELGYTTDGITWHSAGQEFEQVPRESASDAITRVVVGESGTIASSDDLINWVNESQFHHTSISAVAYGDGKFVTVSYANPARVLTSVDGQSWQQEASTPNLTTQKDLKYFGGQFVSVGHDAGSEGTIFTSPDGVSWTQQTSPTTHILRALAASPFKLVCVGNMGTLLHSDDGITWQMGTYTGGTPLSEHLFDVTCGFWANGMFLVWRFVAVGRAGRVLYSNDGVSWTDATGASATDFQAVTSLGKVFVACSEDGTINRSVEGINWSSAPAPYPETLKFAYAANSEFRLCGEAGFMWYSSDGLTWYPDDLDVSGSVLGAAIHQKNQILTGSDGMILQGMRIELYLEQWPQPMDIRDLAETVNWLCD